MSCANTSLPWFIDPPRAMLPRGVAKPKFEIQIETKKINRLCVFHQQLTGAESPNVGTLLPRFNNDDGAGCNATDVFYGSRCFSICTLSPTSSAVICDLAGKSARIASVRLNIVIEGPPHRRNIQHALRRIAWTASSALENSLARDLHSRVRRAIFEPAA